MEQDYHSNVSIVEAFRDQYYQLSHAVQSVLDQSYGDPVAISRVGDDLDRYMETLQQVCPPQPLPL